MRLDGDSRVHSVIEAGASGPERRAILQRALEKAWEFVPPKRRTRANRDALAVAIVRSAARGNSDPGLLSALALSSIIPEVPRGIL